MTLYIYIYIYIWGGAWMTSRLAAPARPTLTMTGLTRAERAKFWILLGIVAEKRSVCLCLVK